MAKGQWPFRRKQVGGRPPAFLKRLPPDAQVRGSEDRRPIEYVAKEKLKRAGSPYPLAHGKAGYTWLCFGCQKWGKALKESNKDAKEELFGHWDNKVRSWKKAMSRGTMTEKDKPTCAEVRDGTRIYVGIGEKVDDVAQRELAAERVAEGLEMMGHGDEDKV